MAIKLADVLENVNSNFAIIETSKHNIVGLYNGSVGTVPSLKVTYESSVKTKFQTLTSQDIQVYNLPFAASTATNQVAASTDYKLQTTRGGLISAHDTTYDGGGGGEAIYIAQDNPVAGNLSDTDRPTTDRWTELIQDFDMYPEITGVAVSALQATTNQDFFLAGYDTQNKKTRKVSWGQVTAALTETIIADLVLSGTITQEQADEGFGGGSAGDVNNDGQVTTADLLEFLGNFGASGVGYETDYTTLSGDTEAAAVINPNAAIDLTTTFALSELTTFNYPVTFSTSGDAYGWGSVSNSINAANFVKLNDMSLGDNLLNGDNAGTPALIISHWASRRLKVTVKFNAVFSAADEVTPLLYVKVTGDDQTPTIQECIYYMKIADGGSYGQGLVSTGADTYDNVFGVVDLNDDDLVVADEFENHSSALENGFFLNHELATDPEYIEDIECRIFFVSTSTFASVVVNKVVTQVIAT